MPDQLQLRGGTTVQHSTFTGASKEVTVDTTKKTAVVHDGSTVGGVPMMREDASNAALALASAANPSLKFTGDTNTGVFSPGADTIAISTGGTSRLAVSTTAVSSTLAVDVPLGAVGTPSLTFTGDLNTGVFSPGADTLALVTGGTNRVHVTSGGLAGIGTSAPSALLHLGVASAAIDGTKGVRITNPAGTVAMFECGASGDSYIGTLSGSDFSIRTNNAPRISVTNAGKVGIGTSSGNANGGILQLSSGITFPATAVAASDVNTLDDYEEGTWTPGFAFAGGTTGITYASQLGVYTKIGRMVTCIGIVQLSSKGSSSGVATITGLPFTVAANEPNYGGVSFGFIGAMTFASVPFARTVAGSTTLTLAEVTTAGVDTDITNADFTNTTILRFTFTYFV
jgi:hypothetical protein